MQFGSPGLHEVVRRSTVVLRYGRLAARRGTAPSTSARAAHPGPVALSKPTFCAATSPSMSPSALGFSRRRAPRGVVATSVALPGRAVASLHFRGVDERQLGHCRLLRYHEDCVREAAEGLLLTGYRSVRSLGLDVSTSTVRLPTSLALPCGAASYEPLQNSRAGC